MKKISNFLNSNAGLMILGFLVTTVGGTILNTVIQGQSSYNERSFEMFKIRIEAAKKLHEEVTELVTKRSFYLSQVLQRVADEDEYPDPEEIKKYWFDEYSDIKNKWNEKLIQFHGKMRILMSNTLSDLLLFDGDYGTILYDDVLSNLDEDFYKNNRPKSLHGAFVAAHATVYHLALKCKRMKKSKECQRWDDLIELANKQINYLEFLINCFSYRFAGELLINPYGPEKIFTVPKNCQEAIFN